ncbi:MAG: hypothetical protein H6622_14400 [Halobacteriovoraceae bacterium]|nr:hypothetical protein [Halobacteriovoraceae bacterium]
MHSLIENILTGLGINSKDWKDFYLKVFYIGLFIHIIIAIFSVGFHHFDEQWQILEFLNYKLGLSPSESLPWEFPNKMRSWMQPGLYYLMYKFMYSFIGANPFGMALVFRLFTSLVGFLSTMAACLSLHYFSTNKFQLKISIISCHVMWMIPYIQVRPSSEGMGSNLLLLSLSLMIHSLMANLKRESLFTFLIGLMMGFAFCFRFQIGIIIMFAWIWYLLVGRAKISNACLMALGIIVVTILNVFVDKWGYGVWTFSPWNYLNQNLVLGKLSGFPPSPWWELIVKTITKGIPPLSIIFVGLYFYVWLRKPKSLFTWSTFPLCLVHSILSHKALRFIFPVFVLAPYALLDALSMLGIDESWWKDSKNRGKKVAIKILIGMNFLILLVVMFKPAKTAIKFYSFVYNNNINKIYLYGGNPYVMVGLDLMFYRRSSLEFENLANLSQVNLSDFKNNWLFVEKGKDVFRVLEESKNCEMRYSNYPLWSRNFNFKKWIERSRFWGLFYCQ